MHKRTADDMVADAENETAVTGVQDRDRADSQKKKALNIDDEGWLPAEEGRKDEPGDFPAYVRIYERIEQSMRCLHYLTTLGNLSLPGRLSSTVDAPCPLLISHDGHPQTPNKTRKPWVPYRNRNQPPTPFPFGGFLKAFLQQDSKYRDYASNAVIHELCLDKDFSASCLWRLRKHLCLGSSLRSILSQITLTSPSLRRAFETQSRLSFVQFCRLTSNF